jgi:ABC-type uncharacterized transport system ATPase component
MADTLSGRLLVDNVEVSQASGARGLPAVNLAEAYRLLPADVPRLLELYIDLLGGDTELLWHPLRKLGRGLEELHGKRLWHLSTGQAKLVTLAVAPAPRARNILLDEPFEGLDPVRRR